MLRLIASVIKIRVILENSFLNSFSISLFKYNKMFQWNTAVKALAFSSVYAGYKQYKQSTILACALRAFCLVLKKIIVFSIFLGVIVQPSKSGLLRYSLFIGDLIAASIRKCSKVYNLIIFPQYSTKIKGKFLLYKSCLYNFGIVIPKN